jgi:hypothetical protein
VSDSNLSTKLPSCLGPFSLSSKVYSYFSSILLIQRLFQTFSRVHCLLLHQQVLEHSGDPSLWRHSPPSLAMAGNFTTNLHPAVAPARQTIHFHLPTLLIDTPDTLLAPQGLFASRDAFQVIGQLCISSPDVHCCTRPSTRQRATHSPATGNNHKISCSRKTNRTRQNRSELRATFEIILPNSTSSSSF